MQTNKEQNFDELILTFCKEHKDELSELGPDFDKIERKVRAKYQKKRIKHRRTLFLRLCACILAALVALNGFLIVADTRPAQAYRTEIRKLFFNLFNDKTQLNTEAEIIRTSKEIENVQDSVPFKIPVPQWVPVGYTFQKITISHDSDSISYVKMHYSNGQDDLVMIISNDIELSNTIPSQGEGNYEQVNIDGNEVFIVMLDKNGDSYYKCIFYNKQGLCIHINCSLDKQSLLDFIIQLN